MTIQAVGAVVFRVTQKQQLQLLIMKKRGGYWTLPKGKVKRGEEHASALLRELREETGLNGQVGELVSQATYTIIKQGRERQKIVAYYLVSTTGGKLTLGSTEDIERLCWVNIPRALQRIRRPRLRAVVHAGLTCLAD
jgi:8-oxo-dGTP pyrophosphatase MutT (NUDIX family)